MIRVLIVDDHGLVRQGLERLVTAFGGMEVVACASSGREAVTLAGTLHPHVVLMDVEMPGELDGIGATRELGATSPGARVVILTSFVDHARVQTALRAGAVGFLPKDSLAEDLERTIRAAALGDYPLDPRAARALLAEEPEPDPLAGLSERECDVLGLVAQGLSNKQIALRLGITERTVKGHLTEIYRHLDVFDRTQAALWAHAHGVGSSQLV